MALASGASDVKLASLGLLIEPAGSSSDHIRMPAVYAIAEIANSTDDPQVKIRALSALAEPLQASQVPIRDVAIDAVNAITRSGRDAEVALTADTPVVSGFSDERYSVTDPEGQLLGRGNAEYTADLVVRHLPPDCGPAFAGTAKDLATHLAERDGFSLEEVLRRLYKVAEKGATA